MKTPNFTRKQLEYLVGLLNGRLKNESYAAEAREDHPDKAQFRAGQRDGYTQALRAIAEDHAKLHRA